jgi:hypothetical protein
MQRLTLEVGTPSTFPEFIKKNAVVEEFIVVNTSKISGWNVKDFRC